MKCDECGAGTINHHYKTICNECLNSLRMQLPGMPLVSLDWASSEWLSSSISAVLELESQKELEMVSIKNINPTIRRWKIHILKEEDVDPIEVSGIFYLQIILSSLTRLEIPYSIEEIKDSNTE